METVNEVKVGDRMRVSFELIRDIQQDECGRGLSAVVELKEVRVEDDGCRVLVMTTVE